MTSIDSIPVSGGAEQRLSQRAFAWLSQRFELGRGGVGQHLQAMEGLRGVAVFLVFLVHYISLSGPWIAKDGWLREFTDGLHGMGNVGVDLFFVLSGFLIYQTMVRREQPFGRFIWRRAVRIYPAFLVVFTVYLALSLLMPASGKLPGTAGEAALYVLANLLLLPGLFPIQPLVAVAWSLSYEFFFYLLVPLVIGALALRERTPMNRLLGCLLVWGVGLGIFALTGGHVRLMMFVAGAALADLLCLRPDAGRSSLLGAAALVLALWVAALSFPGAAQQAFKTALIGAAFLVLCYCAFSDRGGFLARSLRWTPLRWLGNMSYSYYLLHGLTLNVLATVAPALWLPGQAPHLFWWGLMPAFAVTLLSSSVLFLLIERPLSLASKMARH